MEFELLKTVDDFNRLVSQSAEMWREYHYENAPPEPPTEYPVIMAEFTDRNEDYMPPRYYYFYHYVYRSDFDK